MWQSDECWGSQVSEEYGCKKNEEERRMKSPRESWRMKNEERRMKKEEQQRVGALFLVWWMKERWKEEGRESGQPSGAVINGVRAGPLRPDLD